MSKCPRGRRALWMVSLAAGFCMLGFYGHTSAQAPNLPFANTVEQQAEIIHQLKELNGLMKEQNALLRSGRLQVVLVTEKKP